MAEMFSCGTVCDVVLVPDKATRGGGNTMVSLYATETVIVHFQNAVVPLV